MERLYLKDPFKITFASLGDRDSRNRKNYGYSSFHREKRREYKDLDEPEGPKASKQIAGKSMVNFLDI
jgi:hypothetical protein